MAPTIRVDDEVYAYLQQHATPFSDTPNDVLRRVLLSGRADAGATQVATGTPAGGAIWTLLSHGVLQPTDELVWKRRNSGTDHRSVVRDDGSIEVADGTRHPTPSAAAKHLAGYEVNGWRVWRVQRTGRTLDEERKSFMDSHHASDPSNDAPGGDRKFIESLPPLLREVGQELLRRVRIDGPGTLNQEGPRFVNRPDNFWTVKIQPRDGSLAISVRGRPERLGPTVLDLKPDRPSYSWFKVRTMEDIDHALLILRRASKRA